MSLLPSLPNLDALSSLGSALDSSTQTPTQTPSSPFSDYFSNLPNDIVSGIARSEGALTGSTVNQSKLSAIGNISWGRAAAFTVGLLMIGGGILMFKQTQVIISGTAKTAAKVAAL